MSEDNVAGSSNTLPEVKALQDAVAAAVASYNKFMVDGVKKYCTVSRKDLQEVKKLANDLRKKALDSKKGGTEAKTA